MTRPIVITGGGTGGHIFPMLAIADALVVEGMDPTALQLVGSRRGQEGRLLGGLPYGVTLLPGRGLRRSLSLRAVAQNLGAVASLWGALAAAIGYTLRWRPSAVVSLGGYAAAPMALAAVALRRPLVLVDLDAVPGAVHRWLGPFAARRLVPFGTSAGRVVVTGVPVRQALVHLDRSNEARRSARLAFRPPIDERRTVIVVMTGSLGSARVNSAVLELARRWSARDDLTLVHVTGRRDAARVRAAVPPPSALDYRLIEFADIGQLWAVADAAICRAGATTVAELAALAIPAVLVPLPGAPGDHQARNAARVCEAGGAVIVADETCDGAHLADALAPLLDPERRATMARAMGTLGRPEAPRDIARVVLAAARRAR